MPARIAIVGGGGGVGSSLACNLLLQAAPYDIWLVDGQSGMARSHEMDLQQVVAAGASGSIAVVDADAIARADVVVVTAAAPLTVNRSRIGLPPRQRAHPRRGHRGDPARRDGRGRDEPGRPAVHVASATSWAHGDACVPLLDRVRADGEPVTLSPAQREAAEDFVRGWYVRHVALDSGRSSTWTSGRMVSTSGRSRRRRRRRCRRAWRSCATR